MAARQLSGGIRGFGQAVSGAARGDHAPHPPARRHSPRTYLDMLCVETAIARLSSGHGKIAEVSAELGFSAQSNFTRFFLQQVGVPPSEYRRSTAVLAAVPEKPTPGAKS
jgi:AraC-like DNA-binding protein